MTVDQVLILRSKSMRPANYVCPVCRNPNYMRWMNVESEYDLKCINCNHYFHSNELYVGKHEKKKEKEYGYISLQY